MMMFNILNLKSYSCSLGNPVSTDHPVQQADPIGTHYTLPTQLTQLVHPIYLLLVTNLAVGLVWHYYRLCKKQYSLL